MEVIRAKIRKEEGMADFIRLLSNGEDDKSLENLGENNSDSDNSEEVNFTTSSHYFC